MNHVKMIVKKAVSLLLVLVMIESMTPATAQAGFRCKHEGAKHWSYLNDSGKHVQICDGCGARLKTEWHDLYNESDWNYQYDAYGHHQICKKCGYTHDERHSYWRASAKIHDVTHGNVLVCTESKCKHISGGDQTSAYCVYDCQYVNSKYHKNTCVYCDYTVGNSKCTPKDYKEHDWQFLSNKSNHWYECKECHAVMDNSGHHYRQSDWEEYGRAVKMTSCDVCGWCKSCKISTKQNDKGNWIEWKETVESIPSSDLPVPGPSDNPKVECDHSDHDHYFVNIGEKHEEKCRQCNKTLYTLNCGFQVETVKKAAEDWLLLHPGVWEAHHDDYMSYSPLIMYLEDRLEKGHYKYCSDCGQYVLVSHNWGKNGKNASADRCTQTCKECGWTRDYKYRLNRNEPSPHYSGVTYFDNFWWDEDFNIHDPEECSYERRSATTHYAECDICGYKRTEACDTDGYMDIPGQPGKHWQFCSKCGGGRKIVECGEQCYSANNTIGHHSVMCPTCCDTYITEELCQLYLAKTDKRYHTYRCLRCDTEINDHHAKVSVKENVIPATADKDGSYDLVERCEFCNIELSRTKVTIPKKTNDNAHSFVLGDYIAVVDKNINAPGTGANPHLEGSITVDGVSEFLANNSKTLLPGVTGFPDSITGYTESGEEMTIDSSSPAYSSAKILLQSKCTMRVTGFERNPEAGDDMTEKAIFRCMTATIGFTYSAFYRFESNGKVYTSRKPVKSGSNTDIKDLPLDLSGTAIKITVPLLAGMSSVGDTIIIGRSNDGGSNYNYSLGKYVTNSSLDGAAFTTTEGFGGLFKFVVSEHWLEHIPYEASTQWSEGHNEYWYSKLKEKFYADIFCTTVTTPEEQKLPKSQCSVTFDKNADDATGTTSGKSLNYGENFVLPQCGFTREGYDFYGWLLGECIYFPGDTLTCYGNTTLKAKWISNGQNLPEYCTISFDADGGQGTMSPFKVLRGNRFNLPTCSFTKEGMCLQHWKEVYSGAIYSEGAELTANGNVTYRAVWCPMYTVTFDPNGGSGTLIKQGYATQSSVGQTESGWQIEAGSHAPPNTYTRENCTFLGWDIDPTRENPRVADCGDISWIGTRLGGDTTVYAIWQKDVLDITFAPGADDATGMNDPIRVERNAKFTIPECDFTRPGYLFDKWSYTLGNTTGTLSPGLEVSFRKDITLTALWTPAVVITFDANGGEGEMEPAQFKNDTYVYLPAFGFSRDGFSAKNPYCWNTKPDGTGDNYSDKSFSKWTESLTLYAQWDQKRFTVTYDPNGGEGEPYTQIVDFGDGGLSTLCPRCKTKSPEYEYTLNVASSMQVSASPMQTAYSSPLTVNFCECCGLALMEKSGNGTTSLQTQNYGRLYDGYNSSLATKFDELSADYQSLIACYPDKDFDRVSGSDTPEYRAYSALYSSADELMGRSMSEITKGVERTLNTCAVIGIDRTYPFVLTKAQYTNDYEATLAAVSRLFGYSDPDAFMTNALTMAQYYHANEAGAATTSVADRLKYTGTVYTANGSFVLPYAFRLGIADKVLLAFMIVDQNGDLAMWVSDIDVLNMVSLYGYSIPESINAELEVYGSCMLYESSRCMPSEFSRYRYVFDKWTTASDGTGTTYKPGDKFSSTNLNENITVYARWTPNFCTITFDPNGGDGVMEPQIVDKDVETPLDPLAFTREGYVFKLWATSPNGTYGYTDGEGYSTKYDRTLYAIWSKIHTITFDANGGYETMEPQEFVDKVSSKLHKNAFLHDTLAFDGWSYTPGGARAFYDESSAYLYEPLQGTTLYARWKALNDVSQLINLDAVETGYTGKPCEADATINFAGSGMSASIYPSMRYVYFAGDTADRTHMLEGAPTEIGTYTVRAVYEDYMNKGCKDAVLKIVKGKRNLAAADNTLLLNGKDKTLTLKISDGDDTAMDALEIAVGNTGVVDVNKDEAWIANGVLNVPVRFVGTGYTDITFALPESRNYEAAFARVSVIAKNGFNVTTEETAGGTVTVSKTLAMEGDVVNAAASAQLGWTLAGITATDLDTYDPVNMVNDSFTMPGANVSVSARFTHNEYDIGYTAVEGVTYGAGLPVKAHYGDRISLSAMATGARKAVKGYNITYGDPEKTMSITADNNGSASFDMPAENVTVTAVVGDVYSVAVSGGLAGGAVTVSPTQAFEGSLIQVFPVPGDGYTTGAITYTAGGQVKKVTVGIDETGLRTYTLAMPGEDTTLEAEFISAAQLEAATGYVGENIGSELGMNETGMLITVDDATAVDLKAAMDAVDVELTAQSEAREVTDDEKSSAVTALSQAGLATVSSLQAGVRVVEKTYVDISLKGYEQTDDDISMTLDITPKTQTVATMAPEGTILGSDNSVPLAVPEVMDVTEATTVTVGITADMATAAGGVGNTLYVSHEHNGKTYEYEATVGGNVQSGYTATFTNPVGYSEFKLGTRKNTVASFTANGTTFRYPSFADAIEDALAMNATAITMHRMPTGEDMGIISKRTILDFAAADGKEADIDFTSLYVDWLHTGAGISKTSTSDQLTARRFSFKVLPVIQSAPGVSPLTYNGKEQGLASTGKAQGGTMEYVIGTDALKVPASGYTRTVPTKKDAGIYYLWFRVIGDADHDDTEPLCVPAIVAKKTLTITADAQSKDVGEEDPELTYTIDGLVEGDAVEGGLARDAGEDAGVYKITQGTLTAGANYEIVFVGADLKINDPEAPEPEHTAHTLVKHEARAATDTTEGNIEYWECSVCGKLFSDAEGKYEITLAQTVIPKKTIAADARSHKIVVTDGATAKNSAGVEVKSAKENETISIAWTAKDKYQFVNWKLTGSTPANAAAASTTFVMGSQDVVVDYVEQIAAQNEVIEPDQLEIPAEEKAIKVSGLAFEYNKLTIQRNTPFVANIATPAYTGEGEAPSVHYVTENKEIVAVDQSGNFYPMGQGSATVTAYCGNKKATCKVTVVSYTGGIFIINEDNEDVTGKEMTIAGGEQAFLTVLFDPYDSTDSRTVKWTTSNNKCVTVKKGMLTVKEVKEETTAEITATVSVTDPSNGASTKMSRTVTIKAVPAVPEAAANNDGTHKLTVPSKKSLVTTDGSNTKQITLKITGKKNISEGEYEIVSVESTNKRVVEAGELSTPVISKKNQTYKLSLTAKHPGTAYIVVKSRAVGSEDGKLNVKRCKVTVKSPVKAVYVENGTLDVEQNGAKKTITMRKGAKGTVEVVLDPKFSTDISKLKFKASGGITYKNGIITANKVTKANKSAKLKVTCGKKKQVVYVTVTK